MVDFILRRPDDRLRFDRGVQQNCCSCIRGVEQWPVECGRRLRIERGQDISYHSNDLVMRHRYTLDPAALNFEVKEDLLSDWIFARKDSLRHRFTDHDAAQPWVVQVRPRSVSFRERAATPKRNARRGEV